MWNIGSGARLLRDRVYSNFIKCVIRAVQKVPFLGLPQTRRSTAVGSFKFMKPHPRLSGVSGQTPPCRCSTVGPPPVLSIRLLPPKNFWALLRKGIGELREAIELRRAPATWDSVQRSLDTPPQRRCQQWTAKRTSPTGCLRSPRKRKHNTKAVGSCTSSVVRLM